MANAFQLRIATWQLVATPKATASGALTFAERIVDDLHAAAIGVVGSSLFFNDMPETAADTCITVRDLGGQPDHDRTARVMLIFRVRGRSWSEARQLAAVVFNHYHGLTNRTITDYRIISARAEGLPAWIEEDKSRRHTVGFNMTFRIHANDQTAENVGVGGKRDPNQA